MIRTFRATVRGKRQLSQRLISVTLGGLGDFASTGIPDEYVRLLLPPAGAPLVLPEISDTWVVAHPDGAPESEPDARVYTVSDHRMVNGAVQIDLDIVLHDGGIGSDWAQNCVPGDEVGLIEPYGLYAAPTGVSWQLLVGDLTGVPAMARILRGLEPEQRAQVVVVVTDAADQIPLPSAGEVTVEWRVVADENALSAALVSAVTECPFPQTDRYVWLAGEARANRAARKHLRRVLGWPQKDFYTCGYWQIDAAKWARRYAAVAGEIQTKARAAQLAAGDDEAVYLDSLEDIYESVGL